MDGSRAVVYEAYSLLQTTDMNSGIYSDHTPPSFHINTTRRVIEKLEAAGFMEGDETKVNTSAAGQKKTPAGGIPAKAKRQLLTRSEDGGLPVEVCARWLALCCWLEPPYVVWGLVCRPCHVDCVPCSIVYVVLL